MRNIIKIRSIMQPFSNQNERIQGLFVVKVLMTVMHICQPMLWGTLIEYLANGIYGEVNKILALICIVYCLIAGLSFLEGIMRVRIHTTISANIKSVLFKKILHFPMKEFDSMDNGEFIYRVEGDADEASDFFCNQELEVLIHAAKSIILVIIVLNISWVFALVTLLGFLFSTVALSSISKKIKIATVKKKKTVDAYYSFIDETFHCFKDIKLFDLSRLRCEMYDNLMSRSKKAEVMIGKWSAISESMIIIIDFLMQASIYVVGIILIMKNRLTLSLFIAVAAYSNMLSDSLLTLTQLIPTIQSTIVSVERIIKSLEKDEEIRGEELPEKIKTIRFDNVSFMYSNTQNVLENVNILINDCGIIGIKGGNGAGKTTIFNLIAGLYDDYTGRILLNERSMLDFSNESLHKRIGMIDQEPTLFHDTLRENLRLWDEAINDEIILSVCEKVKLIDFIHSLPAGLDYVIQENGNNISIGEKKRIAIARALIRDNDVILLDEVTSSLDEESRMIVIETLKSLMDEKILLLATHNYDDYRISNYMYELKNKRIAKIDTC